MISTIKTQRLVLRAPEESNLPTFVEFYADGDASRFSGGPKTAEEALAKLVAIRDHWAEKGFGVWAIEQQSDGKMVGVCGFNWPTGWLRRELTWWLLPSAQGQGFATEASQAVIEYAYREYKWELVETHMKDENEPARRLVERLGGKVIDRLEFSDGVTRNIFAFPKPNGKS
ncbi:MAG: GNAT family N-acetyltransferase [Hyphomicrobiales bacterium]|nr:MAG: GNAT family N-acetyltransferase [Hyphomicrobiales bacterium]